MDDLIYRNALIEELKKIRFPCMLPSGAEYLEGVQTAVTRISGVINDAPAVNRWIPVLERLPEKQGRCLVTTESGQIEIRTFLFSLTPGAAPYFSGGEKVIAWSPMPDAYKPQEVAEDD